MTKVYLVRHAHSVYSPEELTRPLSEKGKRDAHDVTGRLMKEKIDAVCSSPYKRAVETVEGLALHIGQEIQVVEAMRERTLSSVPVDNFQEAISMVWGDPAFSFEGGESNLTAQKRGVQGIKKIVEEYNGKNVVIGTHGNIMVLIMNHFDESYDVDFWRQLEMPDIYCLTFDDSNLHQVSKIEAQPVKKDRSL
ncbi:histidine phosphatase family protein [Bacillus sp. AFS015802]|uniref:histidine phosphatase family protein n=1 Tax=Bacillus sp. AFS015802 TaxID=2033486 RepID=UPI000BF6A709|nr:histidine phosphatase family protein [Bacillus sp. AFS015802]PFA69539.1 histidine phosphatase family protein [Bacillus sp. AFS015802]